MELNLKDYPLILQVYLPIIKRHYEKYRKEYFKEKVVYDHYEWFMIDIFKAAFFQNFEMLKQTEEELQKLKNVLGEKSFRLYSRDLLKQCMHVLIFEVYKKIIDFYTEMQCALKFYNQGYIIIRILKKAKGQQPDFKAAKGDKIVVIECKTFHMPNDLINASIKIQSIKKYLISNDQIIENTENFNCPNDFYMKDILKNFNLSIKDWANLKKIIFSIQESDENKKFVFEYKKHSFEFFYKPVISVWGRGPCLNYSNLILIQDKIHFIQERIKRYILKQSKSVIMKAKEQLSEDLEYEKCKKLLYVIVILNKQDLLPFEGMDKMKEEIKKDSEINCTISKLNIEYQINFLKFDNFN